MTALKFNKVKNLPTSGYNVGDVFFVSSEKKIYIRTVSGWEEYNGGFTTAEKTKLAGIEAGANKVTKVSQLTNDEHYINNSTLYEAKLKWGGDNFSGTYGPLDAALVSNLGANRLAFLPAECIDIEYSRDGGVTWNNYTTTDADKISLFISRGIPYYIGGASEKNIDKSTHQLRITIKNTRGVIYNNFRKFVLYVSTNGSTGCWCTIDGRLQSDVESDNDTWKIFINKQPVSGWSGYNVINYPNGITTYSNNKTSQYGNVRFTFGCTSHNQNYDGLNIMSIQGFGGEGWATPSTLALTGHLYEISTTKAAKFPGPIYAPELIEGSTTLSSKYAPKSHTHKTSDITDLVIPDISGKQNKTDNALTTTSKQVVGAINEVNTLAKSKQDALTSGTNIKTVNGQSLLGSGDVTVGDVTAAGDNTFTGNNVFNGIAIADILDGTQHQITGDNGVLMFASGATNDDIEISGVATPTYSNSAANKQYVDDKVAAGGSAPVLVDIDDISGSAGVSVPVDVFNKIANAASAKTPIFGYSKLVNGTRTTYEIIPLYVKNVSTTGTNGALSIQFIAENAYNSVGIMKRSDTECIILISSSRPFALDTSVDKSSTRGIQSSAVWKEIHSEPMTVNTATSGVTILSSTDKHKILCYADSGTQQYNLPSSPVDGETFLFLKVKSGHTITIQSGTGNQNIYDCSSGNSVVSKTIASSTKRKITVTYSSTVGKWFLMADDFLS